MALAFELRSTMIVYGPDCFSPFQEALAVERGASLQELLATARRVCGDPAESIRGMANDDEQLNLTSKCYYVELSNDRHS